MLWLEIRIRVRIRVVMWLKIQYFSSLYSSASLIFCGFECSTEKERQIWEVIPRL